jgi:3-dehydroquinate synthase
MNRASAARTVRVATDPPYDVVIGWAVAEESTRDLLGERAAVAVIHQPVVSRIAARIAASITARTKLIEATDGEAAKSLGEAARLWDELAATRITRTDAIVAVGGGSLTDLAGFVASTWLRGIDVVHVPTTLLGMVDAAIGGKTGINTAAGKNLVGTFHQPIGVVCDLDLLSSLSPVRIAEGAAECAKCGFIADPEILRLLDAGPGDNLEELVHRAVRVKARVVGADATEAGPREVLNYGHTLGHAIERAENFRLSHGEAIAIGMVFAAEVSTAARGLDPDVVDRHRELLGRLGLPTCHRADAWPDLLRLMQGDKKTRGSTLRMVLLDEIARPVVDAPTEDLLEAAYRKVSA